MYEVSLAVQNTGIVKGDEVVQLYVAPEKSSVPRPVKELKGFSKVSLNPGESKNITMIVKERDLAYWDINTKAWKIESGKYNILIGSSSRDIKLTQALEVK